MSPENVKPTMAISAGDAPELPTASLGDLEGHSLTALRRASRGQRGLVAASAGAQAAYDQAARAGYAAGHTEGFETGLREGRAAAEAQFDELRAGFEDAVAAALSALQQAATQLAQHEVDAAGVLEDTVVAASFTLATALVGRDLTGATAPVADSLARALALVPARERTIAVRLNPVDADNTEMLAPALAGRQVEFIPDPGVEVGGAVVEFGATEIDAQLSTAVARVAAELQITDVVADVDGGEFA